jgi:hypothetical protein
MELDNAFVNVLCKKYFKGMYTPINLGMRGKGNRATIKDLSMFPGINWNMAEEIIVIYCPSSPERFDFIADQYYDGGGRWECMWPHDQKDIRKNLWDGYRSLLWSEKFGVIEQIAHMQELKMWCKLHNAKLIITPAFDGRFTREYFNEQLGSTVVRDHTTRERTKTILSTNNCRSQELIDQWPWENMFCPDGQPTFVDAVIKKEFPDSAQLTHFFEYTGKGSPDLWITACAHPSAKGHDYFASLLYNYITQS